MSFTQPSVTILNRTIWLLWLQGWENAPWLQRQVAKSWEVNNPTWTIQYVCLANLKEFVTDIDYIYDETKQISPQIKSDIIRVALLHAHGGVWADATMLCMQPLDHWIHEAVHPAGLWMYHGTGGGLDIRNGPAIWFIVSIQKSPLIERLKQAIDEFWRDHAVTDTTSFLDARFRHCYDTDQTFRNIWKKVPFISCEEEGQAHCLHRWNSMIEDYDWLKRIFEERPPYALKMWSWWHDVFPDPTTEQCMRSTGYYAIQLSNRCKEYKHEMTVL